MAILDQDIIDISEFDSVSEQKALVEFDYSEDSTDEFNAPRFLERDALLKNLFGSSDNRLMERIQIYEYEPQNDTLSAAISDKVLLISWKNVENVSARLIEICDDFIVLECVVDKDAGVYEEKLFRKSLFVDYDLDIGSLFYLRFFERKNEMKMEIHLGKGLVSESDFPKIDFVTAFKESKLFKK